MIIEDYVSYIVFDNKRCKIKTFYSFDSLWVNLNNSTYNNECYCYIYKGKKNLFSYSIRGWSGFSTFYYYNWRSTFGGGFIKTKAEFHDHFNFEWESIK